MYPVRPPPALCPGYNGSEATHAIGRGRSHYYTTVNSDGHFTFTTADIGVRHEWKVTVNRGLTVAGAYARCVKWNYRSRQHKVSAAVNLINRSGHLMLPVTVNDLKKQKKSGQARRAHPEARRAHQGNPSTAGS